MQGSQIITLHFVFHMSREHSFTLLFLFLQFGTVNGSVLMSQRSGWSSSHRVVNSCSAPHRMLAVQSMLVVLAFLAQILPSQARPAIPDEGKAPLPGPLKKCFLGFFFLNMAPVHHLNSMSTCHISPDHVFVVKINHNIFDWLLSQTLLKWVICCPYLLLMYFSRWI